MNLPIVGLLLHGFHFFYSQVFFRVRLWRSHVLMIPLCIVFSVFIYFLESKGVNATKLHDTFNLGKYEKDEGWGFRE